MTRPLTSVRSVGVGNSFTMPSGWRAREAVAEAMAELQDGDLMAEGNGLSLHGSET
jgi:hypothetical protein